MGYHSYPESVKKYIFGFSKHGTIDSDNPEDRMLINYLYTQDYDEDFVDSMQEDRKKDR